MIATGKIKPAGKHSSLLNGPLDFPAWFSEDWPACPYRPALFIEHFHLEHAELRDIKIVGRAYRKVI
jgi:hypothetical protein